MPHIEGYLGKITKDLEIKVTQKGTKFINFSVANDEGFGDNKRTDFIPCTAFNKTAETIAKFFKKGDSIIISGKWQNSPYKQNEKGYDIPNWQYIVSSITFLPKPKASNNFIEDGFTPVADDEIDNIFGNDSSSDDFANIASNSGDLPF